MEKKRFGAFLKHFSLAQNTLKSYHKWSKSRFNLQGTVPFNINTFYFLHSNKTLFKSCLVITILSYQKIPRKRSFRWKRHLFTCFTMKFSNSDSFQSFTLWFTWKYPLRGYILGVLTHTTAWDRHWGGDEILNWVLMHAVWLRLT